MKNTRILAFDFGASSGRAMLCTLTGSKLNIKEIHRFSNEPVTVLGTMRWDIMRLFYEIKQSILIAKQNGGFDSIGIDTWGVDFGLIDKDGDLLCNPLHYRDKCTDDIPKYIFENYLSKNEIYKKTGIQFMHFNTLYQLEYYYLKKPELMKLCDKILFIPDLFAYFLTGKIRAEATIASTSNMLNPHTKDWDYDLLDKLGIDKKILPKIINPGEIYGNISDEIAEELGIDKVPVIAVATHDTASAVVSAPCPDYQSSDFCYISCGTWSLFGTETDKPVITNQTMAENFTNEGGYDNTTRLLKNIMGLWLIQESRRQYKREGQDYSFAQLESEAKKAESFKCFIDVDSPEFESAGNMPKRVMDYCQKTNQYVPQTVGEVLICIYQSLAMKYRYIFNTLQNIANKDFSKINVLGGGIKDTFLMQMTADAAKVDVFAGPAEATVTGNIAVQLIALDEVENLQKARQIILDSTEPVIYTPQNSDEWDKHYQKYLDIINK